MKEVIRFGSTSWVPWLEGPVTVDQVFDDVSLCTPVALCRFKHQVKVGVELGFLIYVALGRSFATWQRPWAPAFTRHSLPEISREQLRKSKASLIPACLITQRSTRSLRFSRSSP